MKTQHFYLIICPLVLLLVNSCSGNKKLDSSNSVQTESNSNLADRDPYFIETDSISSVNGPQSITRNILQDKKGNIWLASWEGIIRYNPTAAFDFGQGAYTNLTNQEGLRRFHVFSVLEDKKGNIWFGTIGAGVYKYDGNSFVNYTTKAGLVNDWVTCMYEDIAGNIWFGTQEGLSRFDGKSFHNFTKADGLFSDDINSILEDQSGDFWFAARGVTSIFDGKNFMELKNNEGMLFKNVRSLIQDKMGSIWLGGNDGLWKYYFGGFTNYTKDFVGYIYEDKSGSIWTGSVDPASTSWILSRYNEKTDTAFVAMTKQSGQIFGIMEDNEKKLWFGTERGARQYDLTLPNGGPGFSLKGC